MNTKKPSDYQTPSKEPFDNPTVEVPVAEPLEAEEERDFTQPKLQGVMRYMGDRTGVDFYGVWCERREWIETFDPFIAKKARGNLDFEIKGQEAQNKIKEEHRKRLEIDRQRYIQAQDAKRTRANKNADAVMGKEN